MMVNDMAKRKKRKESSGSKVKFSSELTGLIFVLISIIGIGSFGPVGHIIKSFAIFLMGTWWAIFILLLLIMGLYMVLKREVPKFFNGRLIGLYLVLISLLAFSHIDYINDVSLIKASTVFQSTIDNFMNTISDNTYLNLSQTGSGLLGAFFALGLVNLFELQGTYIVLAVIGFFGLFMFLNLSFVDIFKHIINFFRKLGSGVKDSKVFSVSEDDEEEDNSIPPIIRGEEPKDDKKVIITSSNDLKNSHSEAETKAVAAPIIENSTNGEYHLPSLDILDPIKKQSRGSSNEELANNKKALERVLNDFQISGKVVEIHEGPAVTQYEVEIKAGTKVSRITSINKEIALALAAKDVRIEAPIPGQSTVGIELPNKAIAAVPIREVLNSIPKSMSGAKILVALGKDLMGRTCCADISKMPHLLVAGATGSGKSVCINSFIASILMFMKPEEIKLVLVDPKKVELSNYNGVPHLLCPVVTDPKKANVALQKIVAEMDRRYELFSEAGAKNIATYNDMAEKKQKNGEKIDKLPYIVVIIDELADLMLVAAKEVEDSIMRITQMARAAGIHLIVATQRPSTDVITGIVKANIPSRISFAVASNVDSRTILDMSGAEKLLGKGDMLFLPMGENAPIRIQGSFITDEEIKKVVDYTISQQKAHYDESLTMDEEEAGATTMVDEHDANEEPLYNDIVEFVVTSQKASASLLQRRFRLGYNRAARCIDLLEERGIIGPQNGSKPREVLVKLEDKNE